MSEAQNPDPEKARKSRSLGSFLLFLLVLFVVIAIVGNDTIRRPVQLSQDEYLWHLHSGRIISQEFRGSGDSSNVIEGRYNPLSGAEESDFSTTFTDVKGKEEEFRQLKAIVPQTARPAPLLRAIEDGWYTPTGARWVTARQVPARIVETGEGEAQTPPVTGPPEVHEKLFVEVLAKSLDAWEEARAEASRRTRPDFLLPEHASYMWLDVQVDDAEDLSGLMASLSEQGIAPERYAFDITQGKGSRWKDSTSMLTTFLIYYGPWILIFAVFMIFMRQMRAQGGAGGVMSFGRSRAQLYSKENRTNVTFDDVAGAEEAKDEVYELVEFLKNPSRFTRIGGRIPRGVLLNGPPGCGKTLLAKAIAGEAEVPFFSISGSDFVEMFVGVGASRVRDLFKQARENSPCIIFLDEIDAVGRRRGSGMGGGHDEREQTLNAILVEMDGFGTDEGIIVVAATNRPDVLDPALLRPGRFDREVTIDLPDLEGREAILNVHIRTVKSGEGVDMKVLARSTPGYSGADLAAIVNEAAIMAVLAKRDEVLMEDLEEARDKVRYGRQKKSRNIEEQDRKITAIHEAGHAIVAALIPETDHPHKVTIVPRGRALGATMVLPDKENYHMQKRRLVGQLCMLFGGRVAEAEFCGDVSAGASDDIRRATDLARAMVSELGMSEKIGPINYAERQGSDFLGTELMRGKIHSEKTAREIDEEVHRIMTEAYERAQDLIRSKADELSELADALMQYETVTGEEVSKILDGTKAVDLRPTPDPVEAPPEPAPEAAVEKLRPADRSRQGDLPGEPGFSPA